MNKNSRTLSLSGICLLLLLNLPLPAHSQPVSPLSAWGNNSYGQATLPADLTHLVALTAGFAHNLGLRADGTVAAWGYNSSGQINVPPGLDGVAAISAGYFHSLALKDDGTLVPWGYLGYGLATVPANLTNIVGIGSGAYHNLAIRADGTVAGWGDSSGGQLTIPAGLANVVAVAGGLQHSIALKADGTVVAWGNNSFRQVDVPAGLSNVVAIASGNYHNLALLANGTVRAWGYNSYGQTDVPLTVTNATAIACGTYHSLALKADGTVVGWGYNSYGQARPPAGLTNVAAMAAGNAHSLALLGSSPTILTQPQDLSVAETFSATFTVVATGVPRVSYQWRFNGADITGATASAFTLANVRATDAGSYSVRVATALGTATSSDAVLTITSPLVARCTDVVVAAGASCAANASIDNGSYDPSGGPITLTQVPPGPYPLGTNLVTLVATSPGGGSVSCSATVVVLDQAPPQLITPRNIVTTNDLNQCGAVVPFPAPVATDACSAVTEVTCTPPSGSFFPVGTTTVDCTAVDAAGNVGHGSFTVTVYDLQPPTLTCPATIVVTNAHSAWASVVAFNPTAQDNCPGLGPVVCDPPSGSAFSPGTHTVKCWVVDLAGNPTTCSFQVTVWPGNQPPVPVIQVSPLVQMPGYTNLTIVASNGTNADAVCNSSQSYDLDDRTFNFAWFSGDDWFSTNSVAAITLPLGLHTITLALDDTFPFGASAASVQVEVVSPDEAVGMLEVLVETSGLTAANQKGLLATLNAATSGGTANLKSEVNQLGAFQNKVRAQLARSNPALANALIQAAQQLIDALSP